MPFYCALLPLLVLGCSANNFRAVPHLRTEDTHLAVNAVSYIDSLLMQDEQEVLQHYHVDELQGTGGSIAHLLVLTNDSPQAQSRMVKLKAQLSSANPIQGINATRYGTEDRLATQNQLLPMTPQMRAEWETNPEYQNNHARGRGLGSLACALGHYRIWQSVVSMPVGQWAVILEDDASPMTDLAGLTQTISQIPAGPDLAFLGVRHCAGHTGMLYNIAGNAWGSTAYAVTSAGARSLLDERFNRNSDHWLNRPIMKGEIAGYCAVPIFSETGDPSMMHN